MRQQFVNAIFIRRDAKRAFFIDKRNMLVENGTIVDFTSEINRDAEIVDLKGAIVTPTFVNEHIHLGETFLRPLKEKMSLSDYLSYAEQRNMELGKRSQSVWEKSAEQTLIEGIQSGTTSINTIRGNEIVGKFPIRAKIGYPIMRSEKLEKYYCEGMKGFDDFYHSCKINGIEPGVFLHSFYSNDANTLEFVKEVLAKYDCFLAVHVAEDVESERLVKEKWLGKNSMELLRDYDMLTPNTYLVHCGCVTTEELRWVRENDCKVVLCPISSNTLMTNHADPNVLETLGIRWSIGSDGLATGETANLIDQARYMKSEYPQLAYEKIFNVMTCDNGLLVGEDASFIVFDNQKKYLERVDNIIRNIINKSFDVESVYICGSNCDGQYSFTKA